MKRRGFLGLLGGAAVAGPKLAVDLGSQVTSMGGIPTPPMGGFVGSGTLASAGSGGDWKIGRIAELRKLLAGKDPEEERRRKIQRLYQVENVERFRLDSLRSVSASHKMTMFIDGNLDRQDRINRMHAERELADLLKFPGF